MINFLIDFLPPLGLAATVVVFIIFIKAKKPDNKSYKYAVGVALAAALFLGWMNVAVGIIGSEDNPANMMYGGVFAVGGIGALISRFQPQGMARTMIAAAFAMILVAVIALITGKAQASATPVVRFLILHVFFSALWVWSARLFQKAAR
jgi:drug/metabolite transporter (DMT)-like permease